MDFSIIIPARNEARKIKADITAAGTFLASAFRSGEIIIVDDGSVDGTAQQAQSVRVPEGNELRVLLNVYAPGKGGAVRTGIAASRGEYVMFADSGISMPFENALRGLDLIRRGTCEIAHGSRHLKESVIRKKPDWDRRVLSRLFHGMVIPLMHLPPSLTDTQCGFKVYRGDAARLLYAECRTAGFAFDVEILVLAQRHGFRVSEFPVEWTCDRDSRLNIVTSPWPILRDLFFIYRDVLVREGSRT
jgi:dolichyl-phosphate beta-glucosyltransferase